MELAHSSLRTAHPERRRSGGGLGGGRDELDLPEGRESFGLGLGLGLALGLGGLYLPEGRESCMLGEA